MSDKADSSSHLATKELKDNTIIVVLGASGDLAKKKTYPALFGLYRNGYLPKDTRIIGYARTKMTLEEYHERTSSYIKTPTDDIKDKLKNFLETTTYVSGQYDKDESFQELNKKVEELEGNRSERNRVFYMALPPNVFIPVAKGLKKNVYSNKGTNRLIVEKPFGKDTESARELNAALSPIWTEAETFRIDHYLGKEMVKNMLILRFANTFFNAAWDKNNISNIQITFKEPFGTEGRGGYFNEFGIIRDVMQNHLLQVLTIIAMERPVSFESEDIRDEKVKVLRSIAPIDIKDTLLGQYGKSKDGKKPGYLDDDTVPKGSKCPTFAATVLYIHNDRWEGVPFILKAGKALNEQKTEVRVQFKDVSTFGIFKDVPRNELVLRVQPGEAVYMKMNSKLPGLGMRTAMTEMDLTYKRRFSDYNIPEAYEALLLDAFRGDHSNFVRDDELDHAWQIFTPLLHRIDEGKENVQSYVYGTRGPESLDDFVEKYGFIRKDDTYEWPVSHATEPDKKGGNKL